MLTRFVKIGFYCTFAMSLGCASLHHIEIGELDQSKGKLSRVEVKASDTGVNVSEAAGIAKAVSSNRTVRRSADTVSSVWQLLTYGPKTGEVTFSDDYANSLPSQLQAACPSHKLTGIMAIRETNKYPVISGEIVRLVGYCISPSDHSDQKEPIK